MKLTREQAIEEHRKMWNWIADETLKRRKCVYKRDYLETQNIKLFDLYVNCFLCHYARQFDDGYKDCSRCPLEWRKSGDTRYSGNEYCICDKDGMLYREWSYAKFSPIFSSKHIADLARKIANLPEKESER